MTLVDPPLATRGPGTRPAVAAAVALLVAGQGIAALSILVFGPPSGIADAAVPAWVFPAVWTVLYPCMAIAIVGAWERVRGTDAAPLLGPWVVATLVTNLSWVPISTAAQEPWVSVLLDISTATAIWCLYAGVRQVAPLAARWMVPLLAWTPITFALSLGGALA